MTVYTAVLKSTSQALYSVVRQKAGKKKKQHADELECVEFDDSMNREKPGTTRREVKLDNGHVRVFFDPQPVEHFGLNVREYLHFTSPIRRYADVIAHRLLKEMLLDQQAFKK